MRSWPPIAQGGLEPNKAIFLRPRDAQSGALERSAADKRARPTAGECGPFSATEEDVSEHFVCAFDIGVGRAYKA